MGPIRNVAIIGAGFSGTLLALNLLRFDGPRATLIERNPIRLGRGVAYSTTGASHLLNVRASNMSAFPDRPSDFSDWLSDTSGAAPAEFARRSDYGFYLKQNLQSAVAEHPDRLAISIADVIDLEENERGVEVSFGDGTMRQFDAVVIANGNLPPHSLDIFEEVAAEYPHFLHDPWAPGVTKGLSENECVLLVGTGLTAIDVALTLDESEFGGRIVAMSRRGLVPRAHDPHQPPIEWGQDMIRLKGSALVRHVRARCKTQGWRNAVDELRPQTAALWQNETPAGRARFLRHLRPYWDVHRHRLAPQIARRTEGMVAAGTLEFVAGKMMAARVSNGRIELDWRPRGASNLRTLAVDRIVNCTGPQGDVLRSGDGLIRNLVARGRLRPDPAKLGIDVDRMFRIVPEKGTPGNRLFAVGPMTRGAFWEIIAVPDIRQQSWALARWLSSAHWVGGEGL